MGDSPTSPPADLGDPGERQKAFETLGEVSTDGVVMVDDEGIIRYANPPVRRILGYPPDALRGEPLVTIVPESLQQAHVEGFNQYLKTGERHLDWTYIEFPGRHKDGHEVPLALSFNEFTNDGDRYFVATFRDISKRKEVERELEQQNDRLDQFASMLAHELRNPLSIAQIYLGFFADEMDDPAIDQIADALDRMDEIIEVLLVLARGEDEVDDRQAVGLTRVAKDAWANVTTADADLKIRSTRTLLANPMQLQHLLENLFRNAIEHSDESITVQVGVLGDGFYVEDTGPGIPENKRDRVVEPGYTTDTEGIGFGLTFVAQLAHAYGWEFTIREGDEGGARFEFTDVETVTES